jgi:hypothetical protein
LTSPAGLVSRTIWGAVAATTANVSSGAASTSTTTGALVVTGGVGIGGNLNVAGNVKINSSIPATNDQTGALVVTGGIATPNGIYANSIVANVNRTGTGVTAGGNLIIGSYTDVAGVSSYIGMESGTSLDTLTLFYAQAGSFNALASIPANQYGFYAGSTINNAVNNFGFYSAIGYKPSNYAVAAAGTANSFFLGNVGIGIQSPTAKLHIDSGNILVTSGSTSVNTTTGALVITGTGGIGVGGNINVGSSAGNSIVTSGNIWVPDRGIQGNTNAQGTRIVRAYTGTPPSGGSAGDIIYEY